MDILKMKQARFFLSIVALAFWGVFSMPAKEGIPALSMDTINEVVAKMSLEEKAILVVGTGMELPESLRDAFPGGQNPFSPNLATVDPAYAAMVRKIREYVPGAAGRTAEITRLGITPMVVADGPAGLRINPKRKEDPNTYYATAFPIASLLACSWDTELLYKVGQAMGNEVLEYGVDAILGPAMNLHRNPLCGRNFEYYSEDPLIKGKKAIVIINTGGVIETASWRDFPDAIVLAWQPGQETGNAVVDVLSGKENPSGKLTDTFPISYNDIPSAKNFPGIELPRTAADVKKEESAPSFMRRVPAEVVYEEDIYVGYRYFNSFNIPVAYEFGFGLSYTQFRYSNIAISSINFENPITVAIDIKNTGEVGGKEVVQVYLSAPEKKLDNPALELIAFGKTALLGPGESQKMSFVIDKRSLASFDETSSSWIAESGKYVIKIGASSRDIRQSISFELGEDLLVQKVNKALAPGRFINRLSKTRSF
jgi:hypothetical protein